MATGKNPYRSPEEGGETPRAAMAPTGCVLKVLGLVAVIGVLIALLLPATRSARESVRRATCINGLKQIGLALHNYEEVYHCLPPAYTVDADGRPLHSWRTLILPFMEYEALYDKIDLSKPWDDPVNKEACETAINEYQCPSVDYRPGHTNYLAVVGADCCFRPTEPRLLSEITDGTSTTLMVLEVGEERQVPWASPTDLSEQEVLARSDDDRQPHPGGGNAAMVDGSVHFLPADTEPAVLRALISIDGDDDKTAQEAF